MMYEPCLHAIYATMTDEMSKNKKQKKTKTKNKKKHSP